MSNCFRPLAGLILSACSCGSLASADNRFQLGLSYEVPTYGNLNIDDDPLYGIDFKYFFWHSGRHHGFASAGYKTDLDKVGSAFDLVSLDLGGQFDIARFWVARSYLEYAIGGTYARQEVKVELLDRQTSDVFDEFGYKASIGLGIEFIESINARLIFSQFGSQSNSRTLGVALAYDF